MCLITDFHIQILSFIWLKYASKNSCLTLLILMIHDERIKLFLSLMMILTPTIWLSKRIHLIKFTKKREKALLNNTPVEWISSALLLCHCRQKINHRTEHQLGDYKHYLKSNQGNHRQRFTCFHFWSMTLIGKISFRRTNKT